MTDVVNKSSADESEEKQRTVVNKQKAFWPEKVQNNIHFTRYSLLCDKNFVRFIDSLAWILFGVAKL